MTAAPELPLLCGNNLHPVDNRNSKGECKGCEDSARFARVETRVERLKRLLSEALPPQPGWQVRALCSDADPTVWSLHDDPDMSSSDLEAINRTRHLRAKVVCLSCPVRKSCLDSQLLGKGEPQGTWGGEFFTSTDRDPLRQARKELASE
jgi:hypothetical protein